MLVKYCSSTPLHSVHPCRTNTGSLDQLSQCRTATQQHDQNKQSVSCCSLELCHYMIACSTRVMVGPTWVLYLSSSTLTLAIVASSKDWTSYSSTWTSILARALTICLLTLLAVYISFRDNSGGGVIHCHSRGISTTMLLAAFPGDGFLNGDPIPCLDANCCHCSARKQAQFAGTH